MAKKQNNQCFNWYGIKCTHAEYQQVNKAFWYLVQFCDVFIRIFKWHNLPKEIPVDIMERVLFDDGKSLFFLDENLGYFALPTAGFTRFNEYGIAINYRAIGFNGKQWERDLTNSVLIKNTPLLSPCLPRVYEACEALANIKQAIKVNINGIKTPYILTGDKTELLTLKNLFKQVEGNEPAIYSETGVERKLNKIDTQVTYVGDKLIEQYNAVISEVLTYLGINNNPIEKAERLVTSEADSNNDFINANLRCRLKCRQKACEQINNMFGLNVSVEIDNSVVKEAVELYGMYNNDNLGGDDNGNRVEG